MNTSVACSLRALIQKSAVGGFQAAGGDDQSLGKRGQLRVGRVFQCAPKIGDPILDRLASYFVVDIDMQMDLGDGNQLETESGGGRCRFSANVLVLRLMVSAYSMLNARTKSRGGSLRWSFSVHFVSHLMGQV